VDASALDRMIEAAKQECAYLQPLLTEPARLHWSPASRDCTGFVPQSAEPDCILATRAAKADRWRVPQVLLRLGYPVEKISPAPRRSLDAVIA
jgi:hypothetical protein